VIANNCLFNDKKLIFTFWEPKQKIPGFIKLCIETWKKFLPSFKIIILDFKKAKEYLGQDLFSSIICKNLSIMVQSDAIRVAILNKYGGIWLDADTIILNDYLIKDFQKYELGLICEPKRYFHYIAFIWASKNSDILSDWQNQIISKVNKCKRIMNNRENTRFWFNSFIQLQKFDYLGNSIIDPIIKNNTNKKIFHIDSNVTKVFPEFKYFKNNSMSNGLKYKSFYFKKGDPNFVINNTKGLIFLHHNWTPLKYKIMSRNEFLNQEILLSQLLANLLK